MKLYLPTQASHQRPRVSFSVTKNSHVSGCPFLIPRPVFLSSPCLRCKPTQLLPHLKEESNLLKAIDTTKALEASIQSDVAPFSSRTSKQKLPTQESPQVTAKRLKACSTDPPPDIFSL